MAFAEIAIGLGGLGWQLAPWFMSGRSVDLINALVFVGFLIVGIVTISTTRSAKVVINKNNRDVYVVKTLGVIRSVRRMTFDDISQGFYVLTEEKETEEDGTVTIYSLWLRLKFESDLLIGTKIGSDAEYRDFTNAVNSFFSMYYQPR